MCTIVRLRSVVSSSSHPTTSGFQVTSCDKSTSKRSHVSGLLYLISNFPIRTSLYGGLRLSLILRKEVIQPHLPIRLPGDDFTPIIGPTFGGWLAQSALPQRLRVLPTLVVWRAVCTRPGNVFTAAC